MLSGGNFFTFEPEESFSAMFKDIVWFIAGLLEKSFEILPALGNLPNIAFLLLAILGFLYWLKLQRDYNKKAEQEGTLK